MRAVTLLLALAAASALAACHRHKPAASLTPVHVAGGAPLSPGLWVQKVADAKGIQETRYCLDSAAAAELAAFDRRLEAQCSRHAMAQAANGDWRFSTRCDMGAWGTVATEGTLKTASPGHVAIEAERQTVGAGAQGLNGPGRVSADLQRVGDCPKDMRPGDVVLPDGRRTRLARLTASA